MYVHILTSKILFCVRIYGRHFLFYFVSSMFTYVHTSVCLYVRTYGVVNLEHMRNCLQVDPCVFAYKQMYI